MTKRILLALVSAIAFSHAAFDDEKTTTGHRYSMNDDTKSRRQGTYGHSNLPLYFSKAVNDAGRCTRVIPG
jgi:hypothetical protein